jgi:outer membrane protein assembly factor BamD (BamD/ComL family)
MVVSTPSITACGWTWRGGRIWLALAWLAALISLPGCTTGGSIIPQNWELWHKPDPPATTTVPEESLVMRDGAPPVAEPAVTVLGGDFEGAKLLFKEKDYVKAAPIFCAIADHAKNPYKVLEEARWFEAECYYEQAKYPDASSRYIQLVNSFPSGAHGELARKRLFDIANYWLDETRAQMEAAREKREGKRWMVWPLQPVHFEDSKPLLDIEGHAIRLLETVYMTNPRSPLAEKALFFLGSVKFYREDWKDADHYFYQLVLNCPNSVHAAKAMQLSILCKEIAQGGPDYDGRRLQEARDLVKKAQATYPELARDSDQFLAKQMVQISAVQAEKDYEAAKYWDRTGHPGSAYFCYDIVKRRYPGTDYADKAEKRMAELRARAEHELAKEGPPAVDPVTHVPGQPPGGSVTEIGPAPRTLPPGPLDGSPPR